MPNPESHNLPNRSMNEESKSHPNAINMPKTHYMPKTSPSSNKQLLNQAHNQNPSISENLNFTNNRKKVYQTSKTMKKQDDYIFTVSSGED